VEPGDPLGAVHDARGHGLGRLRGQVRVGAGQELIGRLAGESGARLETLAQLYIVGWHASCSTGCAAGYVARPRRTAGVRVVLEAAAHAAVEVIDARRAEAFGVGRANQQILDRTPDQTELVVGGVGEG